MLLLPVHILFTPFFLFFFNYFAFEYSPFRCLISFFIIFYFRFIFPTNPFSYNYYSFHFLFISLFFSPFILFYFVFCSIYFTYVLSLFPQFYSCYYSLLLLAFSRLSFPPLSIFLLNPCLSVNPFVFYPRHLSVSVFVTLPSHLSCCVLSFNPCLCFLGQFVFVWVLGWVDLFIFFIYLFAHSFCLLSSHLAHVYFILSICLSVHI